MELTAPPTTQLTQGLTWERLHFTSYSIPYEALLLRSSGATPPLVVLPHGGPHVATPADFLSWPVCLASLGFAVLMGMCYSD